jgi:CBS-domain-containing membrane protein
LHLAQESYLREASMPFISQIMGKQVVDMDGLKVGKITEVFASQKIGTPHPLITAIEIGHKKETTLVPITDVAVLFGPAAVLNKKIKEVKAYKPTKKDLHLERDILDKQIIDTNGVRVVRVNDLDIVRVNGSMYIANVDISVRGIMRRLGFKGLPHKPQTSEAASKKSGIISWDAVELISSDEPMRLKVPSEKISDLHPADLAEILSDLSRAEGSRLLQSLNNEMMADTLEEVEPEFQATLVEELPNERVADVLEEMSPDEAADLLAELPKDRSEQILKMMQKDEAADVQHLLSFPEDSAGGIMNTEFVTVPVAFSATKAIDSLRKQADEVENVYYVYVVDKDKHIKGAFTLRELVIAKPDAKVTDFMEDRVVTVNLKDSQQKVAQVIAKYNLLAVPVVDDESRIHGIVTADDALDKIIPTAWKKRLPRFYH